VVRRQLEQVLGSPDFDASRRSREFLRFIVEEALAGRGEALTQSAIATKVFGRKEDFDAVVDPIVRIQAGRLRRSLERYYLLSGKQDPVRIELPKGAYVPVFRGATAAEAEAAARDREAAAGEPVDDWPSVVLSQLEAVGPDPELVELAVRFNEELSGELGRYRVLRVFLQRDLDRLGPSGRDRVRFALTGRLRQEDDGLRVTARLVDRMTGEQVWSDEYSTAPQPGQWSGSPDDIARIVAARVGAEEGVIVQLLAGEHRQEKAFAATPYGAILRSYDFFLARDPTALPTAVEALRQVVAAEPEYGLAWTCLARLCLADHAFEVTAVPTPVDQAITYAHNGVRVDPTSRRARCVLASALLVKGELAAAREELEQALRSNPASLVYLEIIGFLLTLLGDAERGPALARRARERNPHCLPQASFGLWFDHLRRGEIELAYANALEYRDPTFFWRPAMRASCLGLLGRIEEAGSEVAELLRRKPDFPVRGRILLGHYIKFPDVMDRVVDGLARAGLELA
jgi:adenylate cyclase